MQCALCSSNVSCNDLQIGELFLEFAYSLYNVDRIAVSRIKDDYVHLCIHQCLCPVKVITGHPAGGSAEESALFVLRGVRVIDGFLDVFYGDKPSKIEVLVNERQLFDPMLFQYRLGFLQGRPNRCSDKVFLRHYFRDRLCGIALEAKIPIRDYADELFAPDYRNA